MSGIKRHRHYKQVTYAEEYPITKKLSETTDPVKRNDLMETLISMNYSQIKALAKDRYSAIQSTGSSIVELDDVVSSMVTEYIKALEEYNPDNEKKATTFSYAQWRLSNAAYEIINASVRCTTGYKNSYFRQLAQIKNAYNSAKSQHNDLSEEELIEVISKEINMSKKTIKEYLLESYNSENAVNSYPYSETDETNEHNDYFDNTTTAKCHELEYDNKSKIETAIVVEDILKKADLTPLEIDILNHYFFEENSYEELLQKYQNKYSEAELNYAYYLAIEKLKKIAL